MSLKSDKNREAMLLFFLKDADNLSHQCLQWLWFSLCAHGGLKLHMVEVAINAVKILKECYFWLFPSHTQTDSIHSWMTNYHVRQLFYGNNTWFFVTFVLLDKDTLFFFFLNLELGQLWTVYEWHSEMYEMTWFSLNCQLHGAHLIQKNIRNTFWPCFRYDLPCWSVWANNWTIPVLWFFLCCWTQLLKADIDFLVGFS